MKFNKLVTIFSIIVLFVVTSIFFQNCGKMTTINNTSLSSLWFEYPYSEKPEVYAELYFFRPPGNTNNSLYDYTFIGGVAPAQNEDNNLSYIITFKDLAGNTVCPAITGYSKSIHATCLGIVRADSVLVEMTVTYQGKNHVFRKIF